MADVRLCDGVPAALARLKAAGYLLVCVSNQALVARGILDENEVRALQGHIEARLVAGGGQGLDAFYYCPHHPDADIARYRVVCPCRKPRPGLLLAAMREWGIDPRVSFMVGDRLSDVAAGQLAGCRSLLLTCGRHDDPPIVSDAFPDEMVPEARLDNLGSAASWILASQPDYPEARST